MKSGTIIGDWVISSYTVSYGFHRHLRHYPESVISYPVCFSSYRCENCGKEAPPFIKWLISTRKLRNVQ